MRIENDADDDPEVVVDNGEPRVEQSLQRRMATLKSAPNETMRRESLDDKVMDTEAGGWQNERRTIQQGNVYSSIADLSNCINVS